jgi:hypothetical protein
VIFSTPTGGETDVGTGTNIRIQFSRDISAATLKNTVRVRYDEAETAARGVPATPAPEFSTQYRGANRVLEIQFPNPLEPFRTVVVELGDGIVGTDQQPLVPWRLSFVTGGR